MQTREHFEALVDARSQHPRGADDIYTRASMAPVEDLASSTWGWRAGAAAAVVAVVIGVAALAITTQGGEETVAGAGGEPGTASDAGPTPEILGLAGAPAGFELIAATDTGASSVWSGPAGDLTVFQQLSDDGRRAERVLAVAVTDSDTHTVIDGVIPDPSETSTDLVGEQEVTFASVTADGRTISTYGQFELARWIGPDGSTFSVATRGFDRSEVVEVVGTLVAGTPADELAFLPALARLNRVPADPVRVPSLPAFSSARQSYESTDGRTLTVGTEVGDWPAPSDLLWWSAGSELTDAGHLLLADGLLYRRLPGGAATASGGPGVSQALLLEALEAVQGMTRAEWRTLVGDADRSDEDVATTTTATISTPEENAPSAPRQ